MRKLSAEACAEARTVACVVAFTLVICLPAVAQEVDESRLPSGEYATPSFGFTSDSLSNFTAQISGLEKTMGEASSAPNISASLSYGGNTNSSATASAAAKAETATASAASASLGESGLSGLSSGMKEARVGEFTGPADISYGTGGTISVPGASTAGETPLDSLGSNFNSVVGSLTSLGGESLSTGNTSGGLSIGQKALLAQAERVAKDAKRSAVASADAQAKKNQDKADKDREKRDSGDPDAKTKFGTIPSDLSMNSIANKNKEDDKGDKEKDKLADDKKKEKDAKEKEKEQKLKDDMEKEFSQIKDPFKPDDYFKLRNRIHENKAEMDKMTDSSPALRSKAKAVFDKFQNMDGDENLRTEYDDFLKKKKDTNLSADPSILESSSLGRHLVPQATHLDNPSE